MLRPEIDHDRLFKELLTTFFVEFLDLFFPEMGSYLDPDGITFLDKELFTDVTEGETHEADIVVRARFRQATPGGASESFFLIHVENQSGAEGAFGRRMFRYWARLFEKYGLPVYPIVVFSYDAPQRPEPEAFQVSFPDLDVLHFRYRVVQLNRLPWRDYVDRPNPVASALMAKMQIAPIDRPRVKLECLRLLATLRLNPAKARLISGFVDTYLRLSAAERQTFDREAVTVLEPAERSSVMQLMTSWMEEGIEQGIKQGREQGREQGIEQGMERIVLRQLTRRVGPLPEDIEAAVRSLDAIRLEELGDVLLDFTSLTDVEQWLNGHSSVE